jgi:putative ABC transport system substrate-binding protein
MAEELVREKVDLIVAVATLPTRAAQRATTSIPIVMAGTSDPVAAGFVKNLARPDGNITGTSLLQNTELFGKRLELLKEAVPNLVRVAVLAYSTSAVARSTLSQIQADLQAEASRIGMDVRAATPFRGIAALPAQFTQIRAARVGALVVSPGPPIDEARSKIAELALKERLPTVCAFREYVEAGGLMSYGANLGAAHRRAAAYVDRILKGARPADLPVEQATTFELVINSKTAKALGLTIPQSLLVRADEVIQ